MALQAGRGPLTWGERPDPTPGPGDLLLQVEACAVCRTDLQICRGDLAARTLPLVPGHQIVGRVLALGEGVDPSLLGRRRGVGWLATSCGSCQSCQRGQENLCARATFTGWDRDGGFASRALARADFTLELPQAADPVALAPLLCGGVIGYRAFRLTGAKSGDHLGLYGFGASALLVNQVATARGCEVAVVTRDQQAQERARAAGVAWVGGLGDSPPWPLQAAITFAPVGSVVVDALRALDRGGICVVNAIHLDEMPAFPYELLYWERRLQSVANFTRQDASEFLQAVDEVGIQTQVERFPLAQADMVLGELESDHIPGAAVLIP